MTLTALSQHSTARFDRGTTDLRQWEVHDRRSDRRLGTVHDVLVDEDGYTRYLDLAVEGRREHVLVPPGHFEASRDRQRRVLYADGLSPEGCARLPGYDHDPSRVDADYERRLHAACDEAYGENSYFERPEYRGFDWSPTEPRERREPRGELAALSDLRDFQVASDDPDPRGWEVVDRDGNHYGTIRHLIGDPGAMRIRYLAMAPAARRDDDREVLIPAGYAALDRGRREVRVDALEERRLELLPRWRSGEKVGVETARRVDESFADAYRGETAYHHPRYRDEGIYGPYAETAETTAGGEGPTVRRRPRTVGEPVGAGR